MLSLGINTSRMKGMNPDQLKRDWTSESGDILKIKAANFTGSLSIQEACKWRGNTENQPVSECTMVESETRIR